MPIFNLIGIIVIGTWFAFGVNSKKITSLETADILFKEDLLKVLRTRSQKI